MMRYILALLLLCVGGNTWAQPVPATTTCTIYTCNTNAPTGYQLGGLNGLSETLTQTNPSLFVGGHSGLNATASAQFDACAGYGSCELLGASGNEITALGIYAANGNVSGIQSVAVGTAAAWHETSSFFTAVGSDSQRNTVGSSQTAALGLSSDRNGAMNFVVAIGADVAISNGSNITVGGFPTTGDVIHVVFTSAAITGSPVTVPYTVLSSDTTNTILAASLATAITAAAIPGGTGDALVFLSGSVSQFSGAPTTIGLDFPGTSTSGWSLGITASVFSGAGTETFTIGTGASGSFNTVGGYATLEGFGLTTAHSLSLWGAEIAPFATTAQTGAAIGDSSAHNITTDQAFSIAGSQAGYSMRGTYGNSLMGFRSGYGITTGGYNTILGVNDGSSDNCITTGTGNVEIGYRACAPSATANYGLSIMNGIYGKGLSGFISTPSAGQIGIMQPSPVAVLDILGPDTSSGTLAFRVQNSTPAVMFSVSDSGTAVFGGQITLASSTTGAATQTFTNSPCSTSLVNEQWIPVSITGQSGTFYVPACH